MGKISKFLIQQLLPPPPYNTKPAWHVAQLTAPTID